MEAKRGISATGTTLAAAVALTTALALTACGSSSSGAKNPAATSSTSGAVGAPAETSAAASGGSTNSAAAGGDSAKHFCDDLRDLDAVQGPQVGKPVPPSTLAVFDRLAGEAPPPVKDAMKGATAAVHGMSGKVDAAGLAAFGTAIKSVTTWASDPSHCPVS